MFGRKWEPITGRVVASDVHRIYGGSDKKPTTETRWRYVVETRLMALSRSGVERSSVGMVC